MTSRKARQPNPNQQDLVAFARQLRRDEPALLTSLDFGPLVRQGAGGGPNLIIGDQMGIPLLTHVSEGRYDHRLALLAEPGDLVMVRRREPTFEAYLRDCLAIDRVNFLEANGDDERPVALQCRLDPKLFRPIEATLRRSKALTLLPYVMNGHIWRLAQTLGRETRNVVHVSGPGPRIARRANDKLWFWRMAREIAGQDAVPPTLHAYGPSAAAGQIKRFAALAESVVIKVPGSAGSAGNIRLDSALVQSIPLRQVRSIVVGQLRSMGWAGRYPLLVGVWEGGVSKSPSAQIWVPLPDDGPPVIIGLFEQRVSGAEGTFVGAVPAKLTPRIRSSMLGEAARIALVLQLLGYYGPCSLDAVVRVDPSGHEDVHWIECNGRWSGVSIPLTAAKKLLRGSSGDGFVVLQETSETARTSTSETMRSCLDDLLFVKGQKEEGVIIVSPPGPGRGISVNLCSVATDQARAEAIMTQARERLGCTNG